MRRIRRTLTVILAGLAGLVLLAGPAAAHVTANPDTVEAGFNATWFRIGHGCDDGQPTTTLRVQIPAGVASVKPEFVPEWEIETETGELPEPVEMHGEEVTEGVTEVSWTGPPVADDEFKQFGISMFIDADPGETLYFPAIQECEGGSEIAWIQIPSEEQPDEDLDEPAPTLTITAGEDSARGFGAAVLGPIGVTTETTALVALVLGLVGLVAGIGALVRAGR